MGTACLNLTCNRKSIMNNLVTHELSPQIGFQIVIGTTKFGYLVCFDIILVGYIEIYSLYEPNYFNMCQILRI